MTTKEQELYDDLHYHICNDCGIWQSDSTETAAKNCVEVVKKYTGQVLKERGGGFLFDLLAEYGGTIESTAALSTYYINQARTSGRMWVDENALGFIWLPKFDRFPETEKEIEFLEKWYPLPVEFPVHLKSSEFLFNKKLSNEPEPPSPNTALLDRGDEKFSLDPRRKEAEERKYNAGYVAGCRYCEPFIKKEKEQNKALLDALKELVELEDIKEMKKPPSHIITDYLKRKTLAWEAARKLVKEYEIKAISSASGGEE